MRCYPNLDSITWWDGTKSRRISSRFSSTGVSFRTNILHQFVVSILVCYSISFGHIDATIVRISYPYVTEMGTALAEVQLFNYGVQILPTLLTYSYNVMSYVDTSHPDDNFGGFRDSAVDRKMEYGANSDGSSRNDAEFVSLASNCWDGNIDTHCWVGRRKRRIDGESVETDGGDEVHLEIVIDTNGLYVDEVAIWNTIRYDLHQYGNSIVGTTIAAFNSSTTDASSNDYRIIQKEASQDATATYIEEEEEEEEEEEDPRTCIWKTRIAETKSLYRFNFASQAQASFPIKLIDTFSYNGERIVYYRLKYLYNLIDEFVIVESRYTFTGKLKGVNDGKNTVKGNDTSGANTGLYFHTAEVQAQLAPFMDKITYLVIDALPPPAPPWWKEKCDREYAWMYNEDAQEAFWREHYQRFFVQEHFLKEKVSEQQKQHFIMICTDADEIPNTQALAQLRNEKLYASSQLEQPVHLSMTLFYYNFKWSNPKHMWDRPYVLKDTAFLTLSDFLAPRLEVARGQYAFLKPSGWHLSYFMTPAEIQRKVDSGSHVEHQKKHRQQRQQQQQQQQQRQRERGWEHGDEASGRTEQDPDSSSDNDYLSVNFIMKQIDEGIDLFQRSEEILHAFQPGKNAYLLPPFWNEFQQELLEHSSQIRNANTTEESLTVK